MMQSYPGADYQHLVSLVASRGLASDWFALGCLLHDMKRWGAAAGCFSRVVQQEPTNHKALCNLGWNLHLAGRSEEGAQSLNRSLAEEPDEGTPQALLSQVYGAIGFGDLAICAGRAAVRLGGGVAINHVAASFALMSAGKWAEGWKEYEHRFAYKIPEFLTRPYRLWRGEWVEHLYLEAEQGLGDTIFALRWLRQASERAERVTLYVQREIYALLSCLEMPGNVEARPLPQPLPQADAWCPLLSLPVALELAGPESERPYIFTGSRRPNGPVQRVGIVWAGSAAHEQAHHRDCPLAYWLRLTEIPGVELHALQVGEASVQMGEVGAFGLIRDRGPELTNMLDTAKVISELDLVIAVDTSVAHLAAAMGVPTWLLVNQRGRDFRWGYEGEATPWYPSMKIKRRGLHEDWGEVMARVDAELRRVAG